MFLSKLQGPCDLAYAEFARRSTGVCVNANGALNRVTYAFVGLLCGNVALLLFLLQNAIRLRANLLAIHMGEPGRQIPLALEMWAFYAPFSFAGWLFVGVPIACFLQTPPRGGSPCIITSPFLYQDGQRTHTSKLLYMPSTRRSPLAADATHGMLPTCYKMAFSSCRFPR